jgi:hypothetical protein
LTWAKDATARLWRARDGAPVGEPLRHGADVLGAVWNHDESRILTWSRDGTARQWKVRADVDFPQQYIPLLVEVMTGTMMDEGGNISVLTPELWQRRRQIYVDIAERHLTECQYRDANLYLKQKPAW